MTTLYATPNSNGYLVLTNEHGTPVHNKAPYNPINPKYMRTADDYTPDYVDEPERDGWGHVAYNLPDNASEDDIIRALDPHFEPAGPWDGKQHRLPIQPRDLDSIGVWKEPARRTSLRAVSGGSDNSLLLLTDDSGRLLDPNTLQPVEDEDDAIIATGIYDENETAWTALAVTLMNPRFTQAGPSFEENDDLGVAHTVIPVERKEQA